MGRGEQVLSVQARAEISQELRREIGWWNRFLKENKRDAMLPGNLRGNKGVSQQVKNCYNRAFREFRLECQTGRVRRKAFLVDAPQLRHGLYYDQYAIGNADDINHIPSTWEVGFYPRVFDISGVALKNGTRRYKNLKRRNPDLDLPDPRNVIQFGDLGENSGDECLMENTVFVDISRLLHHIEPRRLQVIMQNFGRLFIKPYRELLITIPRACENPAYEYKTSYPVDVEPIMNAVQEGAKKDLVAEIIGRHHFCEQQWYTTFAVTDPSDRIPGL